MSARPSLNRRSDGNSQPGARGNDGSRHGGAAPRNRNEGPGSRADRINNSNATSPESRSGDNNRGSTNAPAGDEQQHRNRSNREHDDRGDPGNRKRSLNQAVAEVVASYSKKIKTSTNSDVCTLNSRARGILRFLGPFVDIQTVFIDGSRLTSMVATQSEAPSQGHDKHQETLDLYQQILDFVPGLAEQTQWTQINNPSGINSLATFLDQAASKGRSDDCGTLREAAIGYIPPVEGIPDLDRKANKELRGFCHHATARMLCPRSMRDEFDKDWEKFSRDVQNGKRLIDAEGLPSFLYPETGYNPYAIDETLLRGPFLVSCYRHVFTGPRTAMKASKGKTPGKKCIADIYNMSEVTPTTIAYIAVLCRYVLSAKASWCTHDGKFNAKKFFQNIMKLFNDKNWAEETLAWWTDWVFGNDARDNSKDIATPESQLSNMALLAAQRAARQNSNTQESEGSANANAQESEGTANANSQESDANREEIDVNREEIDAEDEEIDAEDEEIRSDGQEYMSD